MVKLESLKKSNQFRLALKEKKFHTDYFSIYGAKNFIKPKRKSNAYTQKQDVLLQLMEKSFNKFKK